MPRKIISQREARRLKKKVEKMESDQKTRLRYWSGEYPGGVLVRSLTVDPTTAEILKVTRRLGHALVSTIEGSTLYLYGVNPNA